METKKLKDLKRGEWFTFKALENPSCAQVWIKEEFDRSEKKYCCSCFGDICKSKLVDGDKLVYTDFIF